MTTRPDHDDEMLERNVTTLLGQAGDPATLAPAARARIRANLLARARVGAAAPRSRVALVGWGLALASTGAVAIAALTDEGGGGGGGQVAVTPPPAAAKDSLTLTDGSTAELGEGGSLRQLGPRRVRVTGKVFLDVVPGAGTFTVETAQGELAVLGTRFVVDAVADRTTASVLRGAVAMRSQGGEEVIRAGEEGTMTARTAPVRRPAPRLSHLVSWVAERRRRDEVPPPLPARSGVLVARNPSWQEQEFPLPLRELKIDVHLENQIARVALDQTFHNPQDQVLEGVYKFSLPPGAAVARLAMYVDGHLNEAAVVERMAARRIYEDVVYQRRDPALLEQMGGSKVSLRVFPLPPRQDKRLILAYTQPLVRTYDDVTLTVPLPDLEQPVADVDLSVKVVGCGGCELASPSHAIAVTRDGADALVTYHAKGERLGDSLVLRVRAPGAPVTQVATATGGAERYLLLRARPDLGAATPVERPRRWVILDDTSASRGAFERRAQAALIDHLVSEIDEHDQVMVIAFDATHRRFASWQDALAIDRVALGRFLAADAGLGETDLGEALAGAARLLDGQAGYVVYVGDGVATGERRTIDTLRDALAGSKATFVGLGVGDGADLTTLDALADATGGLATHVDLADDLGWRALDVVASLYTPRLTGLAVDTDAPGALAYLRSRQVAAGEDLDVVIRAPAATPLTTVTVRGQAGGRPWQQVYRVADLARPAGDAGYLPRLWAQRRLDGLVTAGDRALAPCTGSPCDPEAQAIAAYHARKAEMVALGKEHFLLSQHTSLIVLENDAMYRQYGVTPGSGQTWAPYKVPATLAVASTPVAPPVTDDRPLWRQAWTSMLTEPATGFDDLDGRLDSNLELGARGYGLGFGVGVGKMGTLGHGAGSGTGTGYGVSGTGRGGGGAVPTDATAATAALGPATAAPVAPAAEPVEAAKASKGGWDEEERKVMPDQPAASRAGDSGLLSRLEDQAMPLVNADGFFASDRSRRASGEDLGGGMLTRAQWWSGPMAYVSSTDWRFDDVTAWLPGLSRTGYDDVADELEAAAGGATGSITDEAAAALRAARAKLRPGRWRFGDDAELVVDAAGRLERSRTLASGAREVLTYDGATLTIAYPDLGLAATREVGDHEAALYSALAPIVPPRPETLARWYRVTLSAPRTLRLTPARGGAAGVELDLGDDGVIVALRRLGGATPVTVFTAARSGAGFALTTRGRTVEVGYHVDESVAVSAAVSAPVTLTLPLRADGHWAQVLASLPTAAPGWRTAQHQRAAAALAANQPALLVQVARTLAAAGGLSSAEQALCGGALAWADAPLRAALTTGDGVAAYLRAAAALRDGKRARFVELAGQLDGLFAGLAAQRAVLAAIEAGSYRDARAAFERLVDRGGEPTLAVLAARRLVQSFAWQNPESLTALDRVAVGRWRNVLRAEAAQYAGWARGYGRGARSDAGDRWVALMEDIELAAAPPTIDASARGMVLASARGQVGWQRALVAWRDRVLPAGDLAHVLAFARAALVGDPTELDAALDRALTLAGDDADQLTEVITLALFANRTDRLPSLLATARARAPQAPALLYLASQAAERRGEPAEAAALAAEAMRAEGDAPVALSALRGQYDRLLRLLSAAARAATGAERDALVEQALAAGRDWRALDPESPARERALGELLISVGRDDDGWRYLSTPIDLAPREGPSFQVAAEALEHQGKLERALGLWRRAFAIDATNPTWLMRAAQVELALGRTADAQATIGRITGRTWHDRFWQVTSWAREAGRGGGSMR